MPKVDYTVSMLIGTKPVSITSPNGELILRIHERWKRMNPERQITLFINEYTV